MDTEKTDCVLDDRWLKEMHQRWKKEGRVAPPDKVGALLDQTVQRWQTVAAAQQGDEDAWKALYDEYHQRAFSIALRIVDDHDTAEDIVGACFSEIFQNRDRLKPEQGIVRLVSQKAKQRGLDEVRRRKSRGANQQVSIEAAMEDTEGVSLPPLVADTVDPQTLAQRNLEAAIVREEVDQLPEEQRVVVNLCVFSELSYAEAGRALNIDKDEVHNRIRKAFRLLKPRLEQRLGEGSVVAGGEVQ